MATSGILGSGQVEGQIRNAILIAGPTASGKSALALRLAERLGGSIVNADSMQVYAVLRVLTARPTEADLGRAPHHLYGHVDPRLAYSTGAWARDVRLLAESGELGAGPPVFVGGTGLYLRALIQGIADMPDIPDAVRDHWRGELVRRGPAELHRLLRRGDPQAAQRLRPTDGQRIARALEVLEASGKSIVDWQAAAGRPLVDFESARLLVLESGRDDLVARIDRRFDAMVNDGALAEVEALTAMQLDPAAPAMKAIGVRQLEAALRGEISIAAAIGQAKIATRQYAKRQATWFRHQLGPEWRRLDLAKAADQPFIGLE